MTEGTENESELEVFPSDLDQQVARRRQRVRFAPKLFAQTSLPYRNPGDETSVWVRRNGGITLTVQPGMTLDATGTPRSIGFPYGTMPRLMLVWMSTEAVRTKNRDIILGESLAEFMDHLGIKNKTGGKYGSITKVKTQMERLLLSTVSVRDETDPLRAVGARVSVATAYDLWWTTDGKDQPSLMPSTVRLSQEFFDECVQHPVPVDMGTLSKLRTSPMRLDIYIWLTHRMSYIGEEPRHISWRTLRLQFGSNFNSGRQGEYKFRRDFIKNLGEVLEVYQKAKAKVVDTGILLLPGGGPDVLPKISREMLELEQNWHADRF